MTIIDYTRLGCFTMYGRTVHTLQQIGGCPRCGEKVGDVWVAKRRVIVYDAPPRETAFHYFGNSTFILCDDYSIK